jgi:transposase
MGRSRGGLTTKIHAVVDAYGLPITLKLTEGQALDGRSAADMLDTLREGDVLLADRAYDSDALRHTLAARGVWANVKPMPRRVNIPAFNQFLYRYRNQAQTLPRRRHAIRQTRRKLPCRRQTRLSQNLDAG